MNYYDEELTTWLDNKKIPYEIMEQDKHDEFVLSINRIFPFSGSKIEWKKTEKSLNFNAKKIKTKPSQQ